MTVLRCPFNGGQARLGVEDAPERLIEHGLLEQIETCGWTITRNDRLDLASLRPALGEEEPKASKMKNSKYVGRATKVVANHVTAAARAGTLVLTVGGDHSLVTLFHMAQNQLYSSPRHSER